MQYYQTLGLSNEIYNFVLPQGAQKLPAKVQMKSPIYAILLSIGCMFTFCHAYLKMGVLLHKMAIICNLKSIAAFLLFQEGMAIMSMSFSLNFLNSRILGLSKEVPYTQRLLCCMVPENITFLNNFHPLSMRCSLNLQLISAHKKPKQPNQPDSPIRHCVSMGSAEPMDFKKRLLEPMDFE